MYSVPEVVALRDIKGTVELEGLARALGVLHLCTLAAPGAVGAVVVAGEHGTTGGAAIQ